MATFSDAEFGTIVVRRSAKSRHIRLRIAPNGTLRASLPLFTSLASLRLFIASSRIDIRKLLQTVATTLYVDGMHIGKSHKLQFMRAPRLKITTAQQNIIVALPSSQESSHASVQKMIAQEVIAALRREAKAYLPRRLAFFAEQHNFQYEKVRFSHASSRWGSCSSNGTISLNIALMKLPYELIDYVVCHELCHTTYMNHRAEFWNLLKTCDPAYLEHRRQLRAYHPYVV